MRMIAEDVFTGRREDLCAMETSGEVGSEKRPDRKRAEEFGAASESARVTGGGKEYVNKIRE